MAAGNRANDGDGKQGYQLGDLALVPNGRASQERIALSSAARPANDQRGPARAPRDLTLAEDELGPSLELDTEAMPARGSTQEHGSLPSGALSSFGSAVEDDFDEDFTQLPSLQVEKLERPAQRAMPEPTAERPKLSAADESKRVAELADFGAAPRSLIASVQYALHVTRRLIALRAERHVVEQEVKQLAERHHDALVAMGSALVALGPSAKLEPLRKELAQVQNEESKVSQASASVERTREDNERAVAALEAQAAELRAELRPYEQREQEAEGAQRKAQEELRRAQAMAKRVEIELRALAEASAAPDARRVQSLETQLAERRAVAEGLHEPLQRATQALGEARRQLALQQGALSSLEDKKRQLQNAGRAREAEVQVHKQEADSALSMALRALAEAAREKSMAALVSSHAQSVVEREAALEDAGDTLVRFDRALTLYDGAALVKGYALLVALVFALIAVVVLR